MQRWMIAYPCCSTLAEQLLLTWTIMVKHDFVCFKCIIDLFCLTSNKLSHCKAYLLCTFAFNYIPLTKHLHCSEVYRQSFSNPSELLLLCCSPAYYVFKALDDSLLVQAHTLPSCQSRQESDECLWSARGYLNYCDLDKPAFYLSVHR